MTIGKAVEQNGYVFVYSIYGTMTCSISAGHGPEDGLIEFTSEAVLVKRGDIIYRYGADGGLLSRGSI